MQELSENILDIAQNSISADAKNIEIEILENSAEDTLTIIIKDDGNGMSEEFLADVTSPFKTTRTTRKVGLGISFLKEATEMTGGGFKITSKPGEGTKVKAVFVRSHIDRQPIGDLGETVAALVYLNPDIDFTLIHSLDAREYNLSTKYMRQVLEGVPLDTPDVMAFVRDYINEHMSDLYGGA